MTSILNKLNNVAVKFMEALDLEDLEKVIVTEGLKLVEAKYGTIYISKKKILERVYSTIPKNLQVTLRKNGFTYQAFKQRKFTLLSSEEVTVFHKEVKDLEVKSLVIIPLCHRKTCIGVLSFDTNKQSFSEEEIKLLNIYGALSTLALKQALNYQEAHKAVEVRDLFISITAHEFRTPLTTIHGYAQLIRSKLKKDSSALSEWTDELNTEVKRLVEMTNELLEISRIKSGKIDYTFIETNLNEIVLIAVNRFKFNFPKYKLEIKGDINSKVTSIGDADKLLQVFTNILENAGKFSQHDKPVIVRLRKKDKWYLIDIKDYGRGIVAEDLDKIFQGFYKGMNTDESQGMGLGLFISKSIIDAHMGKLKVSSKLGIGTTFTIHLPIVDKVTS